MPRILSIDPGHTTGVAVFDEAGNLEFSMTVDTLGLGGRNFFRHLTGMSRPDVVLIERIPSKNVDEETSENFHYICHWFTVAGYPVKFIGPSQWKGLVKRVEIPGQHARDAATMAKWYLNSRERVK